jgi:RNA recognition motif-containing protein
VLTIFYSKGDSMNNKIYVGNLSFNVSQETLTSTFEQYGSVDSCKIITDRDTGRSKGFAFVEMSTGEEAQEAISNLDGQDLEGRNLRVNEAKPQEKRERSFNQNRW